VQLDVREISGDTTIVVPGSSSAGNWKPSDFPEPVGITASTSCPSRTARTRSSWPVRKD